MKSTNANLLAYSEVISGLDVETATDAHLSEEDFNHIVNTLFDRLNNFSQCLRFWLSQHPAVCIIIAVSGMLMLGTIPDYSLGFQAKHKYFLKMTTKV